MAKILVADDLANIRKLVRINLERAGHDVIEAENKEEAFELVQSETPDLLVLDVMMPKHLDGFQVVRDVRRKLDPPLSEVPIIMLTALHDHTDLRFYPDSDDGAHKGRDYLPVQEFLDKPVDPAKLIEAVEKHLVG